MEMARKAGSSGSWIAPRRSETGTVDRPQHPARRALGVYAGSTRLPSAGFGRHRGVGDSSDPCAFSRLRMSGDGTRSSLVMKGSTVRIRASASLSRKSLHIGISCCLGRRGEHITGSEGVHGSNRVNPCKRADSRFKVLRQRLPPGAAKDVPAGSARVQPDLVPSGPRGEAPLPRSQVWRR